MWESSDGWLVAWAFYVNVNVNVNNLLAISIFMSVCCFVLPH